MGTYVADFETTTKIEDCRVWAYAVCEVGNTDNVIIGTSIDEFMEWCENILPLLPENMTEIKIEVKENKTRIITVDDEVIL